MRQDVKQPWKEGRFFSRFSFPRNQTGYCSWNWQSEKLNSLLSYVVKIDRTKELVSRNDIVIAQENFSE